VGAPPERVAAAVAAVRQAPEARGLPRARWRLADLPRVVPALAGYSPSGVWRLLRRGGVRLKRGRLRIHSPDPEYGAKLARLARARALARAHPARVGLWFGDEAGVYRQPTLAGAYAPRREGPVAELSHRANTRHRRCAALGVGAGRVVHTGGSRTDVAHLRRFLRALRAADPDRYLFLAWDNWPVHKHDEVLAEAKRRRIRLLWLPTYAPWTNPVEKLWRWLRQEVVHHHRHADDWAGLTARVGAFLDRFAHGSDDLLRYVGEWAD
jgi:hypothetical protein